MSTVSEREKVALKEIATEAGSLLLDLYGKELDMVRKGTHDYATGADIQSERLIIGRLREHHLPYTVMAEEKLEDIEFPLRLGDEGILYVDPLEGTHNFSRKRAGFGFGVTLGLVRDGIPTYVVFFNPTITEMYEAELNQGAYLNGERLQVSQRAERLDVIFNHWPDLKYVGSYLDKLRGVTEYTPTSCSDAIDIWTVARGSADGLVYVFKHADTHDLISTLGITEAGGVATNIKGQPWFSLDRSGFMKVSHSMLAGNPMVHQKLLSLF